MDNSKPVRGASAPRKGDRAPQATRRPKPYRPLSDARCRELYLRSLGIKELRSEAENLIRAHQTFVDDIFNDHFDTEGSEDAQPAPDSAGAAVRLPEIPVKMTHFQARVWAWLQSRSHLPQGICHAAATLARSFGCSIRYVQRALKHFVQVGILRRVVDYGLRTRRRFFVVDSAAAMPLFPAAPESSAPAAATNFLGALECADSAHSSALTSAPPPPDPPIEVSGETTDYGGGPGAEPPPLLVCAPEPTEERLIALADEARQAIPEHPLPAAWIKSLVDRFGFGWVQAAMRRAQKRRRTGATVGTGYVIATLNGFALEGGPPPDLLLPDTSPKARMSGEEWAARFMERMTGRKGV